MQHSICTVFFYDEEATEIIKAIGKVKSPIEILSITKEKRNEVIQKLKKKRTVYSTNSTVNRG